MYKRKGYEIVEKEPMNDRNVPNISRNDLEFVIMLKNKSNKWYQNSVDPLLTAYLGHISTIGYQHNCLSNFVVLVENILRLYNQEC